MDNAMVRVDIAALERLPVVPANETPAELEKCGLTCLGKTCTATCGITG